MKNKPVYSVTKKGNEIAHLGWANNAVFAARTGSACGLEISEVRPNFYGSLGTGFSILVSKD